MTDPNAPPPPDWRLVDFLLHLRQDQEAGVRRPLREYLARHPEHEAEIAREFLLVQSLDGAVDAGSARVGPFELLQELGSGGEGTVHLAHDTLLGRNVALKVLARPRGELDEARVLRAAAMAARLDHPALARVFGAGRHERSLWVATAFVDGHSLAVELERRRTVGERFTPAELGALLAPVARGLHHAHEHGVVHRDVKPANLLLRRGGGLVLADFGLARDEDPANDLTATGEVRGTLAYMAPEQLRHGAHGAGVDVYALGVVACECATLRRPFEAVSAAATMERVVRTEVWSLPGWHRLERDVQAVLATAMAKDPQRRYASALAFAEDLERLAAGVPVAARRPGPVRRAVVWTQHHRAVAASLVFAALMLATALAVLSVSLVREHELRAAAQQNADRAQQVACAILFDQRRAIGFEGESVAVRTRQVRKAAEALDALAAGDPANVSLQRERCLAWLRLAEVLADDSEPNLADAAEAERCLDVAETVARERLGDDPRQRALLATALVRRAGLHIEEPVKAAAEYEAAIATVQPVDREARTVRGAAMGMLAQIDLEAGSLTSAREWIERARAEFRPDLEDHDSRLCLLSANITAAIILASGGDPEAAERLLRDELPQFATVGTAVVREVRIRSTFDRVLATCLMMQNRFAEARALFDASVERCRTLVAHDGTDRGAGSRLVEALLLRAHALRSAGHGAEAAADSVEAAAVEAKYGVKVRPSLRRQLVAPGR